MLDRDNCTLANFQTGLFSRLQECFVAAVVVVRKLGRHVLSKFLISGEIAECARQSELGIVSLCLQQCK